VVVGEVFGMEGSALAVVVVVSMGEGVSELVGTVVLAYDVSVVVAYDGASVESGVWAL